jgi:hypothetical protein
MSYTSILERGNNDLSINRGSINQSNTTKQPKDQFMKLKEISLIAVGAAAAVAVMAAASVFFYTPKAQAQASSAVSAPGGVSVIVSSGANSVPSGGSSQYQGGTIVLQDAPNRKVTVYAYSYNYLANGNPPSLTISGASTFTY